EYKVMALAAYGTPRHLDLFRELVYTTDDGGFVTEPVDWGSLAKARTGTDEMTDDHADLAASVQARLEEIILELAGWLYEACGGTVRELTLAGGVALNCVANARLAAYGPFDRIWVQPAAGDAGTALGAALHVTREQSMMP